MEVTPSLIVYAPLFAAGYATILLAVLLNSTPSKTVKFALDFDTVKFFNEFAPKNAEPLR